MGMEYILEPNRLNDILKDLADRIVQLEQGNDEGARSTTYGGEISTRQESGAVLFRSGTEETTGTEQTAIFSRTGITPVLESGEEGANYPFLTQYWVPADPPTMSFNSLTLWKDLFEFRGAKFNDALAVSFWARATSDIPNTSAEFRVIDRLNGDTVVPATTGSGTPSVLLPLNTSTYLLRKFDRTFRIYGDVGSSTHLVLQGRLSAGVGPVQVFMDKVVGAPV